MTTGSNAIQCQVRSKNKAFESGNLEKQKQNMN